MRGDAFAFSYPIRTLKRTVKKCRKGWIEAGWPPPRFPFRHRQDHWEFNTASPSCTTRHFSDTRPDTLTVQRGSRFRIFGLQDYTTLEVN